MTAIQRRRWWIGGVAAFLAVSLAVAALVTATAGSDRTATGETPTHILKARGASGSLSVS